MSVSAPEMLYFRRGTANALVNRFALRDPLPPFDVTLTDPTTVTVTIESSDGSVTTTYTFGVDGNVTNPLAGTYVCNLDPQLPTGIYHWKWIGTGAVEAESEGYFEIIDTAVGATDLPKVPILGPATMWISGQDVANCTGIDYGSFSDVFDTVAYEASQTLYEISGRQFPGYQTRIVRPTADQCSCWSYGPASYGFGPFWWTGTPFGFGGSWWWFNEAGDKFGCAPMSKVRLAGRATEIVEVLIDGVELPEFVDGVRQWRLDKWRYLVRMNTPGDPATPNFFPGCQDMSLDSDQPGTFEITYVWGADAPQIAKAAAVELANQLYLSCGGSPCTLPAGVTQVTRQGITVERGLLANWMDPEKPTGLIALDTFLTAYWGSKRGGRVSAIWSPDQQGFARAVGTDYRGQT